MLRVEHMTALRDTEIWGRKLARYDLHIGNGFLVLGDDQGPLPAGAVLHGHLELKRSVTHQLRNQGEERS